MNWRAWQGCFPEGKTGCPPSLELLRGQPPGGWRNCREPEALRPNSFLLCQQVRHWCGVFKQDISFQPGGPHCLYLSLQFLS